MKVVQRVAWAAIVCLAAVGCVDLPEPAPEAPDLESAYQAYERPTARIPDAVVGRVVTASGALVEATRALGSLRSVRTMIEDANTALEDSTELFEEVSIQGSLRARFPCTPAVPGAAAMPASATLGQDGGTLDLTLRVAESRIARGSRGVAQSCRSTSVAGSASLMLSANLVVDLGGDLAIGDPVEGALLVRATDIVTEPRSKAYGTSYDVRVTGDQSLEVLVDLATLGVGASGTVVVVVRADDTIALREQRGSWVCNSAGKSCKLGS